MKKNLSSVLLFSVLLLAGCGSGTPMTEEEQAAQYGLTVDQFRTEKKAAARMNMNFEDHMQMRK